MAGQSSSAPIASLPAASDPVSPEAISELREQLTKGEDVVDPKTWAGSIPAAFGIAPRLRIGADRWFNLVWLLPIAWGLLLLAVAVAQRLRGIPTIESFAGCRPAPGDFPPSDRRPIAPDPVSEGEWDLSVMIQHSALANPIKRGHSDSSRGSRRSRSRGHWNFIERTSVVSKPSRALFVEGNPSLRPCRRQP